MLSPALRRLLAAAAATIASVALLPAAASATTTFTRCAAHRDFECATVDVPLDRTGRVPGTVPLHVERMIGTGGRSTAWVGLAGGPGQSAAGLAETDWRLLAQPVAGSDQVVTFDQRGTGQSGLIDCTKPFRQARSDLDAAARCGTSLGDRRAFYTTSDSVADLDAVRQAIGADRVTLVGVSYGTYVAERYARAHPDLVAGLVLDSTVPLTGIQQWNQSTFEAVGRILQTLCADGACPFTRDAVADLRGVVRKLDSKPRGGTFVTAAGKLTQQRLGNATPLVDVLLAGDFSPLARAYMPGALSAAQAGDWAPLIRLVGLVSTSGVDGMRAANPEADESNGLYLATSCTDTTLPWAASSAPGSRGALLRSASDALPASTFGPFDRQTSLALSVGARCLSWPATPTTPFADPGTPIPVPALVLSGGADIRTPTADAQQIQAAIPGSTLVTVDGVGHYVLGNDPTGCAVTAYKRFLTGVAVGTPCAGVNAAVATQTRPPTRLTQVAPIGARGTAGRLARVAARTMVDAYGSAQLAAPSRSKIRLGGLRGGRISGTQTSKAVTLTLTRDQYLKGVAVSGTVTVSAAGFSATLTVDGGRASRRGTIRIRGTSLTGKIGSTRITATAGSRSAHAARAQPEVAGPLDGLVGPGGFGFRPPGTDIG